MVKIKDIARLANTSIGTVDRAINNKPGISAETKQRILKIAASLDYTPNKIGQALVRKNKNIKLGFILGPTKNPYFEEMRLGLEQAKKELNEYGITTYIHAMDFNSEENQILLLEELKSLGVSGIALNAINSEKVRKAIDALVDSGIKIVTCNTDNKKSKRSCFIGFENEMSGRVAAELLAKFNGEKGRFLVDVGFKYILAHMDRLKGFKDKIAESYPDIKIVKIIESEEDDAKAFEKTLLALNEDPGINGIFEAGFGITGVVNAVKKKKLKQKVKILGYDYTSLTEHYVKEGLVDAIICQDPVKHGYVPLKILSELVMESKEPKHKVYLTGLDIRLRENLHINKQEWDI